MRRARAWIGALGLAAGSLVPAWAPAADDAVSAPRALRTAGPGEGRVIVRFREPTGGASAASARESPQALRDRRALQARELGLRLGLVLEAGTTMSAGRQVLTSRSGDAASLAAALAAQPEIAYAVPDRRRHRLAVPDDPLYAAGPLPDGPAAGQWYLRAPDATTPASIDAAGAWDLITGRPDVVVAVLDTGVRYDHRDLLPVDAGGALLPGYDMIDDTDIANDGDARDADASDPGDWLTQDELARPGGVFEGCADEAQPSSWHGTQVASLVAALTDNGLGMAGTARGVRVLPVRVLGKCGGYDSDILDAMRWAAGLPVPGLPANPNPARVINLSLGSQGECGAAWLDVVREVTLAGVTVVATAGNSAGHAVTAPANCPGVLAVGAVRHVGSKVGFSDLGPEIGIAAPGGNCVNTAPGSACLYPILAATNAGATLPSPGDTSFTDAYDIGVGTSFAAPLVAGTAALMLSARPTLRPDELVRRLKASARPFPQDGLADEDGSPLPRCSAPRIDANGQPVDQLQCACTTTTCGAGLLDARAAVASVLSLQPRIAVEPEAPVAAELVSLRGDASTAAAGRAIVGYRWSIATGGGIASTFIGATDGAAASLRPSGAGRFVVALEVTDDRGDEATTTREVVVMAAASGGPGNPGAGGGKGGGAIGGPGGALVLLIAIAMLRRPFRFRPRRAVVAARASL